jgi:HK97 family phage prohead protease
MKRSIRQAPSGHEFRYRAERVQLEQRDDVPSAGGAGDLTPQARRLRGHAAVFDTPTAIGPADDPWWIEKIARGAFTKTIGADDIRALFNHDDDNVLGRTTNGTCQLSEDDVGLLSVIEPADTTVGRDVLTLVERGDINQMSFGFRCIAQTWQDPPIGSMDPPTRTLTEVQLWDVSPVTFPAYPETDIALAEARAAGLVRRLRGDGWRTAARKRALAIAELLV